MSIRAWLAAAVAVCVVGGGGVVIRHERALAAACDRTRAVDTADVVARRDAARGAAPAFVVIGDSYAQGQLLPDPLDAFPYLLGSPVAVDGRGGSGLIAEGPCGSDAYTNRIAAVAQYDTGATTLIVESGLNDAARGDVTESAIDLLARWSGPRVLVGPPYTRHVKRLDVDANAAEQKAAAEQAGATFVDLRALPLPLLPDGQHATPAGHRMISEAVLTVVHAG